LKKRDQDHKSGSDRTEEDFASLLEEHLRKNPPQPKTDPKPSKIDGNKTAPSRTSSTAGLRSIDLHGMTLDEAKSELRRIIAEISAIRGTHQLRIITGKGRHSGSGGGVLISEIHDFFARSFGRLVKRMDENPDKLRVSGKPIRGHFDVELIIK
jgi:DNA-nicking Smr family endonuclease